MAPFVKFSSAFRGAMFIYSRALHLLLAKLRQLWPSGNPLKGIIGTNFLPVLVWKSTVDQGLIDVVLDQVSGPGEPLIPESLGSHVAGFLQSRGQKFLRVLSIWVTLWTFVGGT